MVIFVGDRPSKRTDPNVPFKGAACEARLMEWIRYVTKDSFIIINSHNYDFLSAGWQYSGLLIIALGNNASKRLGCMPHFKLPHPSGRNRQINDKAYIINKLDECKKYLERS